MRSSAPPQHICQGFHGFWNGGDRFDPFFGDRVDQAKSPCMKRLACEIDFYQVFTCAVEGIADDRVADVGRMDPDLVSASGFEFVL